MGWTTRSLNDTSKAVRSAFRQFLPGTDAALKNNLVTVTGKVLAQLMHELELRVEMLVPQLFLASATGRFLERHCADIGITRRPAAPARGTIAATAAPGAVYPAGLRFVSGNTMFVSTAPATADGAGGVALTVTAQVAGADTNRDAGAVLTLAEPLTYPSLGREALVAATGLGGGAGIERDASLRARGLQRKRNPPQGGALTDYERIALSVPGVVAAWARRSAASPGSLFLHFLFEGRPGLIPAPADVAAVQAKIDAARLIRVDDSVAVAPIARPVDITIAGLTPDTPELRAAIETAMTAMFAARCRPGVAGDEFVLPRSWISEVIATAAGEDRHRLDAPSGDLTLTGGQFPALGTVTYA